MDYADLDVLYTYDPVSNRESEVETAPDGSVVKNRTSTYNTRDQLTTLTDNLDAAQSVTYRFDAKGNTPLCLLYTSPSPRDLSTSRMPSSA